MTIACPDCGTLEDIPALPRRSTARCVRCQSHLATSTGRSVDAAFASSVATLLLLIPVDSLPLLRVDLLGRHSESSIGMGIAQLWRQGWIMLAGLSALFVIALPLLRHGLLTAVLGTLQFGGRPQWLGRAFRWAVWLDPWAMLDVFLLAVCVGYYYLTNIEHISLTIEIGGWYLIGAGILSMLSRATLDTRTVWRAIGGETAADAHDRTIGCRTCDLVQPLSREGMPCPRCGARVHARKRDATAWAAALIAAAFILLFPANIYPMNVSIQLGTEVDYTNLAFVEQLFRQGAWPLSVVTFWTSILTPGLQILALAWCVLSVWRRSRRHLIWRTRALRIVVESERWTQTSPFAVAFFVPLIDFGALGSEAAGWGATAFMAVGVLLLAASITFDPRRMWDVAQIEPR